MNQKSLTDIQEAAPLLLDKDLQKYYTLLCSSYQSAIDVINLLPFSPTTSGAENCTGGLTAPEIADLLTDKGKAKAWRSVDQILVALHRGGLTLSVTDGYIEERRWCLSDRQRGKIRGANKK